MTKPTANESKPLDLSRRDVIIDRTLLGSIAVAGWVGASFFWSITGKMETATAKLDSLQVVVTELRGDMRNLIQGLETRIRELEKK